MTYTQTEMWPKRIDPLPDDLLVHLQAVKNRDDAAAVYNRGVELDKLYTESEHPDMCLVMEALGICGQSG